MKNNELLNIIGLSIKSHRIHRGLTQKELANLVHVSEKTIARAECGKTNLRMTIILEISKALEVSLSELTEL